MNVKNVHVISGYLVNWEFFCAYVAGPDHQACWQIWGSCPWGRIFSLPDPVCSFYFSFVSTNFVFVVQQSRLCLCCLHWPLPGLFLLLSFSHRCSQKSRVRRVAGLDSPSSKLSYFIPTREIWRHSRWFLDNFFTNACLPEQCVLTSSIQRSFSLAAYITWKCW